MAIPSGYSLLGRIGYNDRGVYTESSDYVRGDVVYHEGSSYVALTTVTGVTPADDNTNWKYLARGFGATELSEIDATDTSGFTGDAGKKVKGQTLIDKIAEYVMSKVVATDAFQTYLQKFLVDNCVTERSDLSLSAAQGKALQDQLATLNSNLISVKTFEIEITTGSTKDPASGLYIGSYKLIESPSYPEGENILAVIPYGARTKLDAGRSAMVAYRASDTRISINSPNQPNEVFVVNIAVFYSFSNN